jgi:hypothetical protein
MKIIVAATRHFHALSRRQVERLFEALPPKYGAQIDEFVLSTFDRWPSPFTYLPLTGNRRVEFCMVVDEKTSATTERAVREMLLGLARIESGSKFDRPLSDQERQEQTPFITKWLPAARAAVGLQNV